MRDAAGNRLTLRKYARAAVIAVCGAPCAVLTPAAAQHEHHGVPASSAQVVLMGTASCADGTPSMSGAVVQLFHGNGPGRHVMVMSVVVATGHPY